jgi:hypothetical protein
MSGSSPPLRSPSEVSSHHPHSLVFEQGGPSKKTPVVNLSLDEEDPIPHTSCDFEFAQRLYDELNRALLGPSCDGKIIIIISDSDEEEEAREETIVDAKAAPSTAAVKPSTPTASPTNVDEDPGAMPNDGLALGQDAGKSSGGGEEAGTS